MTILSEIAADPTAPRRQRPVGRWIGWGVVAFLSIGVGGYAVAMVLSGFALLPAEIAANGFPVALRVHIAFSGVALLLGPFQFLAALRARWPRLHRWSGRIYVLSCLVGGVTGGLAALTSANGWVARIGFLMLAIVWLTCTVAAYQAIRRRDIPAHRRWMIRSFAVTFAAVTLRIYLPLAMGAGADWVAVYPMVAWLCWVPNLLVAQALVRRIR